MVAKRTVKRKKEEQDASSAMMALVKKTKMDIVPVNEQVITVRKVNDRVSALLAPTMLLSGHAGAVYSFKFDATGQHAVSGSFDRSIFLWNVYGDCRNYSVLTGHKNAVLETHWTYDSSHIVSCSADKSVGLWDAQTAQRVKKLSGHTGIVNSCCPVRKGPALIVSGSDDGTVKLWDPRLRACTTTFAGRYQVTAVAMHDDRNVCFSGGLDGVVNVWDIRQEAVLMQLDGHTDVLTSLSLSPDGTHLLSNAMDNTLRTWDIRSFVTGSRLSSTLYGVQHNNERHLIRANWSPAGDEIISGSADRNVYVWDAATTELKYQLPGHKGCVTDAAFHPKERIIGSCSIDKDIFLGELVE